MTTPVADPAPTNDEGRPQAPLVYNN